MEERELDITITEQEARDFLQRYKSGEGGARRGRRRRSQRSSGYRNLR